MNAPHFNEFEFWLLDYQLTILAARRARLREFSLYRQIRIPALEVPCWFPKFEQAI